MELRPLTLGGAVHYCTEQKLILSALKKCWVFHAISIYKHVYKNMLIYFKCTYIYIYAHVYKQTCTDESVQFRLPVSEQTATASNYILWAGKSEIHIFCHRPNGFWDVACNHFLIFFRENEQKPIYSNDYFSANTCSIFENKVFGQKQIIRNL